MTERMKKMFIRKGEKRVSPVFATVLMVAMTVVLAAVLYVMVGNCATRNPIPIGVWCDKTEIGSTKATVEFGEMSRKIRPLNLEFVLIRNNTTEATYGFSSNADEQLVLKNGTSIGTLTFENHGDMICVDAGDRMILTSLAPNSEYVLKMIWAPTGDDMDSITFSTISE